MAIRHYTESYTGRPQSPGIEHRFEDAFAVAIKEICESKGLYQNVNVDTSFVQELADDDWSVDKLTSEFSMRPLVTEVPKGVGGRVYAAAASAMGVDPVGTPNEEMSLGFFLPVPEIDCKACKKVTPHGSLPTRGFYENPFQPDQHGTVQVLHLMFECTTCQQGVTAFQILRRGLRLQLAGRTAPYRPRIGDEWPNSIRDIVQDALVAAAEGDVPAAFYHLRTAQEYFMKEEVGMAITEKVDGKELCEKYNATADPKVVQDFPSMTTLYSTLSDGLHTRSKEHESFEQCLGKFSTHLRAKKLFAEVNS